jgi:hypothetical protein
MQSASIGRIVHVTVNPADNNGSDIAAAIVTRTWGEPFTNERDELGERQTINVRVLLDQRETPWHTSIELFADRPSLEALDARNPHAEGRHTVAFWPPRT